MVVTTHDNDMWGMVSWCGDVDGKAALITTSKVGATLWIFEYKKGGWFKSDKSYWNKAKEYPNKEAAYKDLKINA